MNNVSVALKSEVFVRRNISDYNFMLVIDTDSCENLKSKIFSTLDDLGYLKNAVIYDYKNMTSSNRDYMKKRGFISNVYYEDVMPVVFLDRNKKMVFTTVDEEHLSILSYSEGFSLRENYEKAYEIESELDKKLDFAFDIDIGYLTDDMYESGGLVQMSVLLNLKALNFSNKVKDIEKVVRYKGYKIDRVYNTTEKAALYNISTDYSVLNPEYTLEDMEVLVNTIIKKELKERTNLFKTKPEFKDELLRSVGMLKYSRVLDEGESLNRIGDFLIALDLEIIDGYNMEDVAVLIEKIDKLNLEEYRKEHNLNQNIGVLRSEVIKNTLERRVEN